MWITNFNFKAETATRASHMQRPTCAIGVSPKSQNYTSVDQGVCLPFTCEGETVCTSVFTNGKQNIPNCEIPLRSARSICTSHPSSIGESGTR